MSNQTEDPVALLRAALQRLLNAVLDPVIGGVHTRERNAALANAVQVLEKTAP